MFKEYGWPRDHLVRIVTKSHIKVKKKKESLLVSLLFFNYLPIVHTIQIFDIKFPRDEKQPRYAVEHFRNIELLWKHGIIESLNKI